MFPLHFDASRCKFDVSWQTAPRNLAFSVPVWKSLTKATICSSKRVSFGIINQEFLFEAMETETMKRLAMAFSAAALAACGASALAVGPTLSGEYVEARTCSVY